jgi:DNA-binding NarL/FixJ family response regulator
MPGFTLTTEALTERELDVLSKVMEGWSNREIATHLWISPETVKSHMTNVLGKLGACDRTHAAILALCAGLLVLS